jgi:phage repressor protein C with HTH and peptisase S24 domain
MSEGHTRLLCIDQQETCEGNLPKTLVGLLSMDIDVKRAWLISEREKLGWNQSDLAKRSQPFADQAGYEVKFNQQLIWNFENTGKKMPGWFRYAVEALKAGGSAEEDDARISNESEIVDAVMIEQLPTFVGAGGGGTGEGDMRSIAFSRGLVESLRISPSELLSIEVEGDSMEPTFRPGDQLLVDRRKTNTAQPGAFCLWDGDGYVVKFIERMAGTEPPMVKVISENARYASQPRLVSEIKVMGRVVWVGRRI